MRKGNAKPTNEGYFFMIHTVLLHVQVQLSRMLLLHNILAFHSTWITNFQNSEAMNIRHVCGGASLRSVNIHHWHIIVGNQDISLSMRGGAG